MDTLGFEFEIHFQRKRLDCDLGQSGAASVDQEDTLRALGKVSAGLQLPRAAGGRAQESQLVLLPDRQVKVWTHVTTGHQLKHPGTAHDKSMFSVQIGQTMLRSEHAPNAPAEHIPVHLI